MKLITGTPNPFELGKINTNFNEGLKSLQKNRIVTASLKSMAIALSIISIRTSATAAPSANLSNLKPSVIKECRGQAKEAGQLASKASFDSCIGLAKEDETAYLKQEYKNKVAKLQKYYREKIKKLETAMAKSTPSSSMDASRSDTTAKDVTATTVSANSSEMNPNNSNMTNTMSSEKGAHVSQDTVSKTEMIQPQTPPSSTAAAPVRVTEVTPSSQEVASPDSGRQATTTEVNSSNSNLNEKASTVPQDPASAVSL